MKKRISAALGIVCLLAVLLALPLPAAATSAVEYHDVDVTVELARDGSAVVTEVWDMTAHEGTEMYLEMLDLDQQQVSGLTVSENGELFQDIGEWDTGASFDEKAGKSGIVTRGDGYELCWGLGSYGHHVFTVTYTMTNMVKGCSDSDYLYSRFLNDIPEDVDHTRVTIRYSGAYFDERNAGVWSGGYTGTIDTVNGVIVAETDATYREGSKMNVLVQFEQGMFSPGVHSSQRFEQIKDEALAETDYKPDGVFSRIRNWFEEHIYILMPLIMAAVFGMFAVVGKAAHGSSNPALRKMKPEYKKDVPYSREVPWNGSLPATYTRLKDLDQHGNDGNIIGAYLLKWLRSRQVEVMKEPAGVFGNKEEDVIRLFMPRLEMEGAERRLYEMLLSAAGEDYVLQSKEFEKWSKRNYTQVQGWLEEYKNAGRAELRTQGALAEETHKTLGLFTTRSTVLTPLGEQRTVEMFGFKRYLQDFTIINEREAREVQLWDQYLIFAQVFGIAEEVADQFKKLYPDYFVEVARQMGTNVNMFDLFLINRLARSYGRAMYSGMRSGVSAASAGTRYGGGGGRSFSGGGGFGGASGGGSRGVR